MADAKLKDAAKEGRIVKQMGIDAQVLIEKLRGVEVGAAVTYVQMSEWIGRDVRGHGYGSLCTARNRLIRDEGIVFGTVIGVGLKRLDDAGKVSEAGEHINAIRRAADRGLAVAKAAEYDALPEEAKKKYNATVSHLGVLRAVTTSAAQKRIVAKVENAKGMLPVGVTLEALK
ncbi:MAG: hypothetical protein IH577_04465 [Deltaproteobacteria bacterium]|nr:hypothetical protein [Deltaproteobacteria bacterium]